MSKDYRIGFLCASTSWGGLEMNVLRLAVWLRDRGWEVVLYGNPESIMAEKARAGGITFRRIVSDFKYGDLVNARRLARRCRKDNVRRLIINYGKDLLLSVLAKKASGGFFKLILLQHMHVGGRKTDFFHTWEYKHLDAWVAPLPMFAERLTQTTRLDPRKISVIPFGIELERFTDNRPAQAAARQRLDLPDHVLLAGVIGRLDPKKGQDVLIRACAGVHAAGHPLHLLVVGDKTANDETDYSRHLRELVARLDLTGCVHMRPYLPQVEYAYAALDMFVMASHSETYGMVTIEAMACSLPVIGTAEGGTVQIIEDNVSGLLVPPRDVERLTEALLKLARDRALAARLGKQAAIDAIRKYSHRQQCSAVEQMLEQIGER